MCCQIHLPMRNKEGGKSNNDLFFELSLLFLPFDLLSHCYYQECIHDLNDLLSLVIENQEDSIFISLFVKLDIFLY